MNSVGWYEILVDDMSRAQKFYEGVFQKKLEPMKMPDEFDMEMLLFQGDMSSYGANGALVKMKGFGAGKNSVLVYFSCEDCSVEESKVVEFGGSVDKTKVSIGEHGFISMVLDSEGNMIGLHSMK